MAPDPRRQRGLMLLLLLVLTGVLAALVVINLIPSPAASEVAREEITQKALAEAKAALLAYVAASALDQGKWEESYWVPGHLPCPADTSLTQANQEGYSMSPNCGVRFRSQVGRLPWKTLRVNPIRDGHGECLWYAVSGTYKGGTSASAPFLNWDTPGQFVVLGADGTSRLAGNSAEDRAVVVILAPGPALAGQVRTVEPNTGNCPGNHDAANYLERLASPQASNASPDATLVDDTTSFWSDGKVSTLISGPVREGASGRTLLNDRVITITAPEIFDAINQTVSLVGTTSNPGPLRKMTSAAGWCMAQLPSRKFPDRPNDRRMLYAGSLSLVPESGAWTQVLSVEQVNAQAGRFPNYSYTVTGPPQPLDPDWLASCPTSTWTPVISKLYRHWKDHLFYIVAAEFTRQDTSANTQCGAGCLSTTAQTKVPALTILSGRRLGGQLRTRTTDRLVPANFLEDVNAVRVAHPGTGTTFASGSETPSFNDLLYCIDFQTAGGNSRVPKVDPC